MSSPGFWPRTIVCNVFGDRNPGAALRRGRFVPRPRRPTRSEVGVCPRNASRAGWMPRPCARSCVGWMRSR